ncbi:glycosyltransferase [Acinetobacter sp. ANC 5380]|uniref:Glycosyltransferase n=1 Tax=Acinetobacter terrae TaxID=2731247 RepID=A0A7Y2WA71_9GAMM|nr:glycosyltransferase [Acinetobacter terrae]NNH76955.1 glycosyltransferase [Acinetobacter terrae]
MDKTLSVLHIIRSVDISQGGTIQAIIQTIDNLPDNQTLEVLCLDDPKSKHVLNFNGKVHAVGPVKGVYGYSPKLKQWIKTNAHRFDVAVIHGLWTHAAIGGWQGCKSANLPYVIFPHGMMDPWFKKTYPLKHLKKQIFWYYQGKVLRDASEVLFTCEEEKKLANGVFLGYSYRPHVVSFGAPDVPAYKFNGREELSKVLPKLGNRPFLLFLSRIHEKKGCDILLKGFAKSEKRSDLQLVMAGPCDSNLESELKEMTVSLGISERVHWPGMLRGEYKSAAFNQAEAFILISHQENFGISVAESLAYGKPVLISNKINIWREIAEGNGGVVSSDTVSGAIEVIENWESLSLNEKLMMGANARKVYETNFTVQKATQDLTNALIRATKFK